MSYKEILDNVSNIENLDDVTILKTLQKFSRAIRDFAGQQTGLQNLLNVEFEPNENAVTYTNGVVDYLGNLKITLANNIIVNKPCSVKFNIKGSETIVVDVDEFDNALEIHLDSDTINKINRALVTPLSTPIKKQIVMIDTNNSQQLEDEDYFIKSSRLKENFIQARWVGGDYTVGAFGSTQVDIQAHQQQGNIFSIENGQFKCLKSGYYKVNVTIPLNVTNNHVYGLMIKLNNVVKDNHWFYVNSYHTYCTSVITSLSENDYLSFSVYNENGSEATVKIPTNIGGYGLGTINITPIKGVE